MSTPNPVPQRYQNFSVAIYARVYEVLQMRDLEWLRERFEVMSRFIRINKVYLETHRDWIVVDEDTLLKARQFFAERGIQTSGGITITVNERNRFQTYCYTNPEHRQKLKEVVEFTAQHFDELILDDFFFTNCKCPSCISAKGTKSWTRFRLDLLDEAARELIIGPARKINPNITLIIKYPNWYEHFQGLGFNLETEPRLFDKLYTGTETRDAVLGNQHLQPYHGYSIFRYFENIKPGANAGGWVDTGGMRTLDRYAEQLWLTLFARAPEITLFDFLQLQRPIQLSDRAPWQGKQTSFDFDEALGRAMTSPWSIAPGTTIALAAGYVFQKVDSFLGQLGKPLGLPCYKPYHSTGEDFLHSYLGMLGIPIEITPDFPSAANLILLTESARGDPAIVEKIKQQLMDGKQVVITSGLLRAVQGKGIEDIVELEFTNRKATVKDFLIGWNQIHTAGQPITIPQIQYLTNDSWEEVSGLTGVNGYPLFHSAAYGRGTLYIWTIPDVFGELYHLPAGVLNRIRETLLQNLPVRLEGPSQVALFVYDNDTFIVESFLPEDQLVSVLIPERFTHLRDLLSGETLSGEPRLNWRREPSGWRAIDLKLKPHSYRVFQLEAAPA